MDSVILASDWCFECLVQFNHNVRVQKILSDLAICILSPSIFFTTQESFLIQSLNMNYTSFNICSSSYHFLSKVDPHF